MPSHVTKLTKVARKYSEYGTLLESLLIRGTIPLRYRSVYIKGEIPVFGDSLVSHLNRCSRAVRELFANPIL